MDLNSAMFSINPIYKLMQIEEATVHLTIKWGKTTLNVDAPVQETLESFKAQLYSLTSVLPEKQKLMCKGKFLKEEHKSLRDLGIADVR